MHLAVRIRVLPGQPSGWGHAVLCAGTPHFGGRLEKVFPVLLSSAESFAAGSVNFITQLILSFIGSGDLSIFFC